MGEKNLRRFNAVRRKRRFVGLHQAHLANGSGGLQLANTLRALTPPQPQYAFGNRAGTHENHFFAVVYQRADLRSQVFDHLSIQSATVVGQKSTSDFHDNATGIFKRTLFHAFHSLDQRSR